MNTYMATGALVSVKDVCTLEADGYLMKIVRDKGLPNEDQNGVEDVLTWNPGNTHRGPKSELREKADALLDDGGNKFERGAINLHLQFFCVALEAAQP